MIKLIPTAGVAFSLFDDKTPAELFKHFLPLFLMAAMRSKRIRPKSNNLLARTLVPSLLAGYARQISQIIQAAYKHNTQAEMQAACK